MFKKINFLAIVVSLFAVIAYAAENRDDLSTSLINETLNSDKINATLNDVLNDSTNPKPPKFDYFDEPDNSSTAEISVEETKLSNNSEKENKAVTSQF